MNCISYILKYNLYDQDVVNDVKMLESIRYRLYIYNWKGINIIFVVDIY